VQVRPGDEFGDPDLLAETYFRFAQERDTPELLINHTDPGLVQFD
jgi:hypothetical protein